MKRYLFILLIPFFFISSCKDKSKKELELLQVYLDENNIDVEPTASGLYYIETLEGTGSSPIYGSIVKVHYEGRLLNGEVFDSSLDSGIPFQFTVGIGQVIRGWDEGIRYMKNGGKATLIIPSKLAYGNDGNDAIPGYSTLIFEIELIGLI